MSVVSFSKTYLGETKLGDTYLGQFLQTFRFANSYIKFLYHFSVEVADKLNRKLGENGDDYADFQGQDCLEGCDIPDSKRYIKGLST